MRDLAARLTAHTEGLLFLVILLLGALLTALSPTSSRFPTPST